MTITIAHLALTLIIGVALGMVIMLGIGRGGDDK